MSHGSLAERIRRIKGATAVFVWRVMERVRVLARFGGFDRDVTVAQPPPKPEWEYVPEGWIRQAKDPAVKGWNVDAIASAYRRKWPSFLLAVEGSGPLGVAHEVPEGVDVPREERGAHHTLMAYGYALTLASRHKDRLSVLDWGGGPGHYYLLSQALLPGVQLDYHCEDVSCLVDLGRELVADVTFSSDQSSLAQKYDSFLQVARSNTLRTGAKPLRISLPLPLGTFTSPAFRLHDRANLLSSYSVLTAMVTTPSIWAG